MAKSFVLSDANALLLNKVNPAANTNVFLIVFTSICRDTARQTYGKYPDHPLPKTGSAAPLMARAASEARNAITSAIAAGSTHLLNSPLGTAARFCGVSIVPGMMQFTLMFDTFNSLARDSVNRSTALFDAL